jgi:hypothetical protein
LAQITRISHVDPDASQLVVQADTLYQNADPVDLRPFRSPVVAPKDRESNQQRSTRQD